MDQGHKDLAEYLSIEEFYAYCGIPHPCGRKTACEGEVARVKGYIDYDNVFDRENYPQLPYEKFKIIDRKGNSLEVWAVTDNNKRVFEGIYRNKTSHEKMVFIKGSVIGFDMPVMGECRRGLAINLKEAGDLFFQ